MFLAPAVAHGPGQQRLDLPNKIADRYLPGTARLIELDTTAPAVIPTVKEQALNAGASPGVGFYEPARALALRHQLRNAQSTCSSSADRRPRGQTINKYLGKDCGSWPPTDHVPRPGAEGRGGQIPSTASPCATRDIDKRTKHVRAIAKAAKAPTTSTSATDPDREGGAISWHRRDPQAPAGTARRSRCTG